MKVEEEWIPWPGLATVLTASGKNPTIGWADWESSVRQLKDDQKGHAQLTEKANVGRRKEVEAMVENIKELNEQVS